MLRLLILFSLATPVLAQPPSLAELLPPGVTLDDEGLVQWLKSDAPCRACEATGKIACSACDRDPTPDCARCKGERKVRCVTCQGARRVPDPFTWISCPLCVGGPDGPPPTSDCALCVGLGRLPTMQPDGEDMRTLKGAALDAELRSIRKTVTTLDEAFRFELDDDAKALRAAIQADVRQILTAAQLPVARSDAIVEQIFAGKDLTDMGYAMARRELLQIIAENLHRLEACAWRLRYNERRAGGAEVDRLAASALTWRDWLGADRAHPADTYTLLGRGFFRAESAPDTEQVIQAWLKAHPKAVVVPVSILTGIMRAQPSSRLIYCWVTDAGQSLNLHLVRQGCVYAGTMQAPVNLLEVEFATYRAFLADLEKAQNAAQQEKLRLWGSSDLLKETASAAAESHMEAGEWEEALVHLDQIVAMGRDDAYVWLDIAECRENLDRYEAALAAYDTAIGDGGWWQPYTDKAEFIERHKGAEPAVAWLEGLRKASPGEFKFSYLLGSFHMSAGRDADAIPHFEQVVEIVCRKHGFVFGKDHMLVLDEATLAKENNDYAELWPTLEYLALCCDQIGDADRTLEYATMGVSIGQQIKRCKSYYEADEIDAGDCGCRLLRAKVFMDRGQLDAAKTEVDKADVIAKRGSYTGHKRAVQRARLRLEALRAK